MEKETIERLPLLTGHGMWHTADCSGKYPSVSVSDGPHGLRKQDESAKTNNDSYISTCYPTASCLAASWDEENVAAVADSIAKETWNADVSVLLGPGVNIKRSPLCGRNFEYFSEDPYLAGRMGTAYVKAVQNIGVGTSLKHFAGNSQETRRMTSNSRIDERTLREIYLAAFEMVVKEADPATIMASYNYLNGTHATENFHLLTEILRKEWGYKGVVVSDWGACMDLTKAIKAGMDLEMPDSRNVHLNMLKKDIENGLITEEEILPALGRMEELIGKYAVCYRKEKKYDGIDPHAVAVKAAASGAVLLKNDADTLPVSNTDAPEINIIGGLAKDVRFQGGGSSHINTDKAIDIITAFTAKGYRVNYAEGYKCDTQESSEALMEEARTLLSNGLPTIFCGGLTDLTEGEGYDRRTLDIPKNQIELINGFEKKNSLIFLSFGGSPFVYPNIDKFDAILHMYLGGEGVAEAAAELISGSVTPSGKLAETWPLKIEDTPAYGLFATDSNEIRYNEGLFVGYRHYDSKSIPVQFPFGFGLSYTTFEYSDLSVKPEKSTEDGKYVSGCVTVSFKVKNNGKTDGAEVAELYVENPSGSFPRAKRELRGFRKVFLKAGEEQKVTVELNERAFSVYDTDNNGFVKAGGDYVIQVGASVCDIRLSDKISVDGTEYSKKDKGVSCTVFVGNNESDLDSTAPGKYGRYNSLSELSKVSWFAKIMLSVALKVSYAMFKGKPHDDPEVLMTVETVKDGPIDCIFLQGGIPYGIAEMIIRQANRRRKR